MRTGGLQLIWSYPNANWTTDLNICYRITSGCRVYMICTATEPSVIRPSGAMDSASDFGSGGWGFESLLGLFFFVLQQKEFKKKKKEVHTGIWTRDLSLRRRAPYPLGHTDMCDMCVTHYCFCTEEPWVQVRDRCQDQNLAGNMCTLVNVASYDVVISWMAQLAARPAVNR